MSTNANFRVGRVGDKGGDCSVESAKDPADGGSHLRAYLDVTSGQTGDGEVPYKIIYPCAHRP